MEGQIETKWRQMSSQCQFSTKSELFKSCNNLTAGLWNFLFCVMYHVLGGGGLQLINSRKLTQNTGLCFGRCGKHVCVCILTSATLDLLDDMANRQ